jgi:hypothetical protein
MKLLGEPAGNTTRAICETRRDTRPRSDGVHLDREVGDADEERDRENAEDAERARGVARLRPPERTDPGCDRLDSREPPSSLRQRRGSSTKSPIVPTPTVIGWGATAGPHCPSEHGRHPRDECEHGRDERVGGDRERQPDSRTPRRFATVISAMNASERPSRWPPSSAPPRQSDARPRRPRRRP